MSYQNLFANYVPQYGAWFSGNGGIGQGTSDTMLLDADEEEAQHIGTVCWYDQGSHTFGTSGSSIGWLPGASITFAVNSTLTVGIKKSSVFDDANGPPGRATIGAAAFSVSKALVGGTDTITSTTWRDDAMTAGTPFTLAHGDRVAVCFHLDTTSGTPSIKVRNLTPIHGTTNLWPMATLVTSGPTYTASNPIDPNIIIVADDGTIGWIEGSGNGSAARAPNIGNGVIAGNVFTFPVPMKISAIKVAIFCNAGAANVDVGLWSTPLGTPAAVSGANVNIDVQNFSGTGFRYVHQTFPTPYTLPANTAIAAGAKQNSATAIGIQGYDVNTATYLRANGLDEASCYAATSTAGAAFASVNSGKSRWLSCIRVSAFDDGVQTQGGMRMAGMGGLAAA